VRWGGVKKEIYHHVTPLSVEWNSRHRLDTLFCQFLILETSLSHDEL
jgi:hypothetical protein